MILPKNKHAAGKPVMVTPGIRLGCSNARVNADSDG